MSGLCSGCHPQHLHTRSAVLCGDVILRGERTPSHRPALSRITPRTLAQSIQGSGHILRGKPAITDALHVKVKKHLCSITGLCTASYRLGPRPTIAAPELPPSSFELSDAPASPHCLCLPPPATAAEREASSPAIPEIFTIGSFAERAGWTLVLNLDEGWRELFFCVQGVRRLRGYQPRAPVLQALTH